MKKILFTALSLIACLSFQSCDEEDIMYYEGGNAVHFINTSGTMTFITRPDDATAIMEVPVQLVGNIQEKDLNFSVEVVNDEENTTATPEQYNIVSTTVPKGETTGYLKVEVKNPDKINSAEKTLKLRLKLVDNDEVKAGGWRDFLVVDLLWSSDLIKPQTWKCFTYFICKKYSSQLYRTYIEATGKTECYYTTGKINDPETGKLWSQTESIVWGKKFGDYVRAWNEEHFPEVLRHDDGDYAGEPIVPIY